MMMLDANVRLYAYHSRVAEHERCRANTAPTASES